MMDIEAEREQVTKFDPEERTYCEWLLAEIENLQANLNIAREERDALHRMIMNMTEGFICVGAAYSGCPTCTKVENLLQRALNEFGTMKIYICAAKEKETVAKTHLPEPEGEETNG